MAKRFTDTNKYKKPFIRGLQGAYKVLWDYLYHDCDHAGIWIVDFEIAQIYVGADLPINKNDALKYFNESEKRIIEIDNGKKWFLPSFIDFQYGELNEQNRAHNSVIKILKNKTLLSSLQGAKDKDKVKELDKDKDKDKGKCKGKPAKPDTSEYKKITDLWFEFVEKRNGVKPSFNATDGQSLKSIIAYISKQQNEGQKTEDTFKFILDRWSVLSEWLQSNALDLKIFNSKINTILDQIKNGTGTKQKGFTERVGQYFDATNPDYKDL